MLESEQSQIVRCRNRGRDNFRGSQARITLPRRKNLINDWDYINFYCGLGSSIECGVSTCPMVTKKKWHTFINNKKDPHASKYSDTKWFCDGDNVTLKMYLDDRTGDLEFRVNDDLLYTFNEGYGSGQARIVLAAAQNPSKSSWDITHSKVTVQNMFLKDSKNDWVAFSTEVGNLANEKHDSKDKQYDVNWSGGNYLTARLTSEN